MAELYRVRVMRGGMVTRIELSGELDLAAQGKIASAIDEALAPPLARRLMIDVRDVTHIDSVAIHETFVMARRRTLDAGLSFHVLPSASVRRALEMTGLDDILE